jgi:hypothetical protein
MLQLCENLFADAVLVELGLNGGNDFVYDRAVDARLKKCLCYQTELLRTSSGEQLTTILFDIVDVASDD